MGLQDRTSLDDFLKFQRAFWNVTMRKKYIQGSERIFTTSFSSFRSYRFQNFLQVCLTWVFFKFDHLLLPGEPELESIVGLYDKDSGNHMSNVSKAKKWVVAKSVSYAHGLICLRIVHSIADCNIENIVLHCWVRHSGNLLTTRPTIITSIRANTWHTIDSQSVYILNRKLKLHNHFSSILL